MRYFLSIGKHCKAYRILGNCSCITLLTYVPVGMLTLLTYIPVGDIEPGSTPNTVVT